MITIFLDFKSSLTSQKWSASVLVVRDATEPVRNLRNYFLHAYIQRLIARDSQCENVQSTMLV